MFSGTVTLAVGATVYGVFAAIDPSITASIISSCVVLTGILLTFWRSRVKQQEIHLLVNNRLDAALSEIRALRADKAAVEIEHAKEELEK